MNTYQQDFSPAPPLNPYQQNTDIIKNFFKRPIVLVFAIVSFIVPLITFTFSILMSATSVSDINSYTVNNKAGLSISFSLPLVSILAAVCYLLIYIFSKNPHPAKTPSAPFTILWVLAIISLVIGSLGMLLVLLFIGIFSLALYVGPENFNYSFYAFGDNLTHSLPAGAIVAICLLMIAVVLIAFGVQLFYTINNLRYLGSIRKSMHSIYLKKNGAMAFGVTSIVFAAFCFLFALASLTGVLSSEVTASGKLAFSVSLFLLGLSGTQILIQGIIAIQYSKYITNITRTLRKDPVPTNTYTAPAANAQYTPIPAPQTENITPPYTAQQNTTAVPAAPMENPYAPRPTVNETPKTTPQMQTPAPVQEQHIDENVCPNCGASIFKSDMFCNNCGTKLK